MNPATATDLTKVKLSPVKLRRNASTLTVIPACQKVLDALQSQRHIPIQLPNDTFRVVKCPVPLCKVTGEGETSTLQTRATMEPVVRKALAGRFIDSCVVVEPVFELPPPSDDPRLKKTAFYLLACLLLKRLQAKSRRDICSQLHQSQVYRRDVSFEDGKRGAGPVFKRVIDNSAKAGTARSSKGSSTSLPSSHSDFVAIRSGASQETSDPVRANHGRVLRLEPLRQRRTWLSTVNAFCIYFNSARPTAEPGSRPLCQWLLTSDLFCRSTIPQGFMGAVEWAPAPSGDLCRY
jgi:hypothetical protein